MFALSDTILLRRLWARNTMRDASALKIGMEAIIFTTPVILDGTNLAENLSRKFRFEQVCNGTISRAAIYTRPVFPKG